MLLDLAVGAVDLGIDLTFATGMGVHSYRNPNKIYNRMHGYMSAFGFEPTEILDQSHGKWSGAQRYRGYGANWDLSDSGFRSAGLIPGIKSKPFLSKEGFKQRMPSLGGAMNMAGVGYMAYQGYQENGMSGAYDGLTLGVAVEQALYKHSMGAGNFMQAGSNKFAQAGFKPAGHPLKASMSSSLTRGAGASIGGYIGQQAGLMTGLPMGGTIGAFVGANVGAAPLKAIKAHPFIGTAMVGTAIAAAGAYGAYEVIKTVAQEGYNRRQSLRGVNTDGSMAAFMTQNAATMRGRSVQAMQRSHMNARSALGQEASFLHTNKNYHSVYR